jgi:hypothetical protein
MIYEPMDPDHDRQQRILVCMGRACDIEVQTLKLVLGQELFGELVLDDSEQLAFEANVSQLRANRTAAEGSAMARAGRIGGLYSPVSCGIGAGRIRGKQFRLAKAGRDGCVFNATELL